MYVDVNHFVEFFSIYYSGPFFRKTVADLNAPMQEKALDALMLGGNKFLVVTEFFFCVYFGI